MLVDTCTVMRAGISASGGIARWRLLVRSASVSAALPRRRSKQKWGGITRDPYKTFQRRKEGARQNKQSKTPLVSDERNIQQMDYPLNLQSLGQIVSNYIPLEKFSKAPLYTREGFSQRWSSFKEKLFVIYSGAIIKRKLKKIDPFRPIEFAQWSQQAFIDVNKALQSNDKVMLKSLATENATESLKAEFRNKLFSWLFINEIERPRIVNARVAPLATQENLYGQVTVRLHSKQIMSVSTLSGQLLLGNKSVPKNVIDYVVFERSLAHHDSKWKICGKIAPQKPYKQNTKQLQPGVE